MKPSKIFALSILLLFIVPITFAKEEQKPRKPDARQASCVVRITASGQVLTFSDYPDKDIGTILRSSGVGIKSAQEILGYNSNQLIGPFMENLIQINTLSKNRDAGNDNNFTFELKIDATEDTDNPSLRGDAREYLQALIEGLKLNLGQSFEDYSKRLNLKIKIAENNAKNAESEFYAIQEQMRKISGNSDISQLKVRETINNLQGKIEDLQIDISQRQAEIEEFTKQIRDNEKRIDENVKAAPGLAELETLLNKAADQLADVKQRYEVGVSTSKEVIDAESKVTELRLQLIDRKEKTKNAYNNTIDMSNRQIASALARISLDKKLMATYENQSRVAQDKLGKSDEYEVLSIKSGIAKDSLRKALENLAALKRNADIVPPTITVMGD